MNLPCIGTNNTSDDTSSGLQAQPYPGVAFATLRRFTTLCAN